MRYLALALAGSLLAPLPALAGDLVLTVRDQAGRPVSDAVVMVYPAAGLPAGPIRFPWPYTLAQKDVAFEQLVLIVPKDARVSFPNFDKVRHHVYSFSTGNRFEIKLYGDGEAPSVVFKTAGEAAIGCNIHDQMAAFVVVVDTPYAAKSNARGVVTVTGLPAGAAKVRLWQPYLKAPKNEMALSASIPAQGAATYSQTVDLRAVGRMTM